MSNSKGFASLILVFFVVIFLVIAAGFFAKKFGLLSFIKTSADNVSQKVAPVGKEPSNVKPTPTGSAFPPLVKVDFTYTIKSISKEGIVLNGKDGAEFIVYNDPTVVTVYKGPNKESPKMELSALKVGDKINMEFVAGKSATLFVL